MERLAAFAILVGKATHPSNTVEEVAIKVEGDDNGNPL
jgi:hypothetical protein